MTVIGIIIFLIGIIALFSAGLTLTENDGGNVKFPKWMRAGFLMLTSILHFSLSGLFINYAAGYLKVFAGVIIVINALVSIYILTYKIQIRSNEFVYMVFFIRKAFAYADINSVNAEIRHGIASITLKVGSKKIALNKMMRGYGEFLSRLEREKVFIKCPII